MKSLLIAMALISTPVLADEVNSSNDEVGTDAIVESGVHIGFGFGFGWGPRHPGWGHNPGPMVKCVAENGRGYRFDGYGRFYEEARRNAMDKCYYRGSRYCEIRWCR
ncbi:MAG TPA: hypothetical protein VIH99_11885 [Bdellovibrionota bacterium]